MIFGIEGNLAYHLTTTNCYLIHTLVAGGYENCLDMKLKTGLSMDGEYQILFAGKNVSIYCHGMNSSMPEEFLTLPTGEQDNFSEIYGMRQGINVLLECFCSLFQVIRTYHIGGMVCR